jgi:hypothetical protein
MLRGPHGDSISVWDYNQNRISVFDDRGNLGRIATVAVDGSLSLVQAMFDDGSLLTVAGVPPSLEQRGLVRPPRPLVRRIPGGAAQEIVRLPGTEMFYQELPSGEVDYRRPFFGHTAYFTTWRDRVIWAATDSFRIHVHAMDGRPLLRIETGHPIRRVTDADIDPLIEKQVMTVKDEAWRPLVRRLLENIPRGTMPVFGTQDNGPPILADDEGNIWVAEHTMAGDDRNVRLVFDSTGVWLGTVALPHGFGPRHIGADFVLGKARDSVDVEHVKLYTLRKPR